MNIERILIYNLKIPFCRTIRHSLYTRRMTESLIVVMMDNQGNLGMGEGTPREYVTGERLNASLIAAKRLSKALFNRKYATVNELTDHLKDVGDGELAKMNPAAFCAVETALLDLWSRVQNCSVCRLFTESVVRDEIVYSGVIPSIEKEDAFLNYVGLVKQLRLSSLKLKVTDASLGLSQLKTIRRKLSADIALRVDANAAFSADAAIQFIHAARPLKLAAIEQPVPKDDLSGLKAVAASSDVPVIADESMYTPRGPFHLIDHDICHGLNIRLSSCGGFQNAHQIYRQARSKNMLIVLGAHVGETAILSYAGRNLALMCPSAHFFEGSFSKYVIREDLVEDDISFGAGGIAAIPAGPGLGIEIDLTAIEKWSTRFASLSPQDIDSES
jgi:muconate cycloisomerase